MDKTKLIDVEALLRCPTGNIVDTTCTDDVWDGQTPDFETFVRDLEVEGELKHG